MSVASQVVEVPKAIVRPLLNPKTLLIGAGVMLGTGAFLSMVIPGVGQWAGLRPMPVLPRLSPWFNRWPFIPMPMNGSTSSASPASAQVAASRAGASQEDMGNAIVATAIAQSRNYIDSMLQVI